MRPIQERLTMLAADLREDSRKAGIAAAEARPDVEDTAAVLATLQQTEAELNAQIDELERRLAETRRHILQAEAEHEQAESVVKRHERDGQEAADMADRLDQLARGHRAPDAVPPAEALAATGLMVEPPKEPMDGPQADPFHPATDPFDSPCVRGEHARCAGCSECPQTCHPVDDLAGDGTRMSDDHPPAVRRAEEEAARAARAAREPVATPPVPTAPAGELVATGPPDRTMPDGHFPPLPPAEPGKARHEKPREPRGSRWTGGFKLPHLGHRDEPTHPTDNQDGADQ